MRIYVASSWRNEYQPSVVADLREAGHMVYDFKNPRPGDNGFHWSEIDPKWKQWSPEQFIDGLQHQVAKLGFRSDFQAMQWSECCILVLPCGRSAHLEAGWMRGAGKLTFILVPPDPLEPELMYLLSDGVFARMADLLAELHRRETVLPGPPHPPGIGRIGRGDVA